MKEKGLYLNSLVLNADSNTAHAWVVMCSAELANQLPHFLYPYPNAAAQPASAASCDFNAASLDF
jgi:hypothetical protein